MAQMMVDVVDLDDLARSVQLLIIGKQVMTDKVSCENFYDVCSEFQRS
jgi:hypothetical protein